jgi:hypothetical protein
MARAPYPAPSFCGTLRAAGLTQFAVRFRDPREDQPGFNEALPWIVLAKLVCNEVSVPLATAPTEAGTPGSRNRKFTCGIASLPVRFGFRQSSA